MRQYGAKLTPIPVDKSFTDSPFSRTQIEKEERGKKGEGKKRRKKAGGAEIFSIFSPNFFGASETGVCGSSTHSAAGGRCGSMDLQRASESRNDVGAGLKGNRFKCVRRRAPKDLPYKLTGRRRPQLLAEGVRGEK